MYFQPTTLGQAVRDAQVDGVRILAGGTDFFPGHGDTVPDFPVLDITRVEGLAGISKTDAGWRIGGATRWADVVAADLPCDFDALKSAALEVGSVQIQNTGTIGGNLCNASPAADGVPPLLILNAEVELISSAGVRLLPLADFLLGVRQTALEPGEIFGAVHIPQQTGGQSAFSKLGSRKYLVISIAMVAVWIELRGGVLHQVRVAVGACSPVAKRLHALEDDLIGLRDFADFVTPEHLAPLTPIDDIRGSAKYRLAVVGPMIERALNTCLEQV